MDLELLNIAMILRPSLNAHEAIKEAKEKGLTRFVGVTGHQSPLIIRQCIEKYEFDTVLIPVNPAEPGYMSFIDEVIPLANKKGMGIIGMKVYLRGLAARLPTFKSFKPFLHFALSYPITTTVMGVII